jgi:hypothetical protein
VETGSRFIRIPFQGPTLQVFLKEFIPVPKSEIKLFGFEVFLFCLLIALIIVLLEKHLTSAQPPLVQEGASVAF